jgi:hypothetical protein
MRSSHFVQPCFLQDIRQIDGSLALLPSAQLAVHSIVPLAIHPTAVVVRRKYRVIEEESGTKQIRLFLQHHTASITAY